MSSNFSIKFQWLIWEIRDHHIRILNYSIENRKTSIEKKTDVAIYWEINVNCWAWEIVVWEKKSLCEIFDYFFWAGEQQLISGVYFGGKFPHPQEVFVCWSQANWCSNQNSNCVNFLRKLEYNQKKYLRKISQMLMLKYLVFLDTGMVDNLIQAWASITMQVLQVPFTWMTNMRWIGTSNMTNRSRLQAKRKHSIPVRFDITCWPNSQCCAMTGKEGGIEWAQFEFTNVRKRNKPDPFTLFCVQFELNTECFEMNSLNTLKSASKCYSFYVMHNLFVLLV